MTKENMKKEKKTFLTIIAVLSFVGALFGLYMFLSTMSLLWSTYSLLTLINGWGLTISIGISKISGDW
jgi:hypothetical protein